MTDETTTCESYIVGVRMFPVLHTDITPHTLLQVHVWTVISKDVQDQYYFERWNTACCTKKIN